MNVKRAGNGIAMCLPAHGSLSNRSRTADLSLKPFYPRSFRRAAGVLVGSASRKGFSGILIALFVLTVCGCASWSSSGPSAAYRPDPGPFTIQVAESVLLAFPALEKDLELRVTFPAGATAPESLPVIIFSHGGRCDRDRYTHFADHWASHGYVVIQPAHLDSSSLPPPKIRGMRMMIEAVRTRRLDMVHVLDSLDEIGALVPGLAGRIDTSRVAAAGHSLGGGTALSVTGLVMVDPSNDTPFGFLDERFDALLLITDPGNSPMMPETPWRVVALPTLVATGTNDFSGLVRHIKKSRSVYRYPAGTGFAATENHYLFVDDMDHYLGGLICKPRDGDLPDAEAAYIIGGVSVAFLDAYLRDDANARAFLAGAAGWRDEQRATLSVR